MDKFSRKSDDIAYEGSREEWDYYCEEKKLELRLGPPGEENWNTKKDNIGISNTCKSSSSNYSARNEINTCSPLLSLGLDQQFLASSDHQEEDNTNIWINVNHHNFSSSSDNYLQVLVENKKSSPWSNISSSSSTSCQYKQSCLPPAMGKKSLQIKDSCGSAQLMVELQQNAKNNTNTAVSDQKRRATVPAAPVVGWPPIRSFRKNLASSCASKLPAKAEASNEVSKKIANKKQTQSYCGKSFFVKINMDGVPIGRKVDLKAYDSYEKLSSVVDELFRGLLAAQIDHSASDFQNNQEGEKTITGLLDGSGEYTLVYEDNEGDRMLVGDVPWSMFVSTVKRLRVQKSSELSSLLFGGKQEKETT